MKLKTYYSLALPKNLDEYNVDHVTITNKKDKLTQRMEEKREYTLYEVTFKPISKMIKTVSITTEEKKIT